MASVAGAGAGQVKSKSLGSGSLGQPAEISN